MAQNDTDKPLTDAEIMDLKPDPLPTPQPAPAEAAPEAPAAKPKSADTPTQPNETRGAIFARSKATGMPPFDDDGNLLKRTPKEQDAENKKKSDEYWKKRDEIKNAKAAKDAADKLAKQKQKDNIGIGDILGVDVGIQVKVPVVGEKSSDPKTIGLPSKPGEGQLSVGGTVDIGKLFGGKEGLAVTFKARLDPEAAAIKAGLSEENQKSIKNGAKNAEKVEAKYDEIKAEGAKIQETAAQMARELKSPQEISDYMTSASANLGRKYGAEAAEYAVWGPNGKPPPPKE
jgi:hypothetical protein